MGNKTITEFEDFTWINFFQPTDEDYTSLIEIEVLPKFLVDDIKQVGHLPKLENYDSGQFFILRCYVNHKEGYVNNVKELSDKISFFVTDKKLITVHRKPLKFLKPKENVIFKHPMHLALYFIGGVLKTYEEPSLELASQIDELEKQTFLGDLRNVNLEKLYFNQLEIRLTNKLLNFSKEVIANLKVDKAYRSSWQDKKEYIEHLLLIYDEAHFDSSNLLQTFLSLTSMKSNKVMELLTIFSAFFLPLTFIAGVYGMNFDYMPELHKKYSYYVVLGIMVAISMVIYLWFKKKKII